MQTYEETLAWIHGRLLVGIKPGLARMEYMMEQLGHPERRMKAVHIGGTNGKGSTTAALRSILTEAGYKTGTFTSPYIEHFNERISVNGQPISDEEIISLAQRIRLLADEMEEKEFGGPSEFEIITAMSFFYFAYIQPVDIVLFEVGLGGRMDSTNIVHPLLSIITTIGMDHMQFLGESIEEIAFEKAGIIKNGVPVITAVHQPEALAVIQQTAKAKKAPLYVKDHDFHGKWLRSTEGGEQFEYHSLYVKNRLLETGLAGLHQVDNGAAAVMAADYLRIFYSFIIDEKHIESGLKKTRWPGRFETLSEKPLIIADGAHNEEGVRALVQTIQQRLTGKKVTIMFAAMKDKPLAGMITMLKTAADRVLLTSFDFPRAATAEQYKEFSGDKVMLASDYREAIELFKQKAETEEVLVITGSLYFISEVKSTMKADQK